MIIFYIKILRHIGIFYSKLFNLKILYENVLVLDFSETYQFTLMYRLKFIDFMFKEILYIFYLMIRSIL